ncbi:MAG: glycosyltransferase family 4 protein [Candidatus Jacksonbacteria bacterium]|nr:glycosyltransferase family 4 protein [Candidatus Jacksonbacteria bacterium]
MTIGIDARLYGTKHGGIGRYSQELIPNLLRIDQKNRYVFFVYSKDDERCISADIPAHAESRVRFVLAPYRCYTFAEQLFMPGAIARAKVDLVHFTHFNVPLAYRAPFVVTIHDLIIHHFPNERATTLPKWLYKIKLWGYKKVMRYAVMKAQTIITPSEFGKQDLLRFYDIPKDKIRVIYEGVSDLKSQIPNPKSQINSKFQISNKKYILYVGSFYPHKNIERLIDAFHILRTKYNLNLKLVLVGKKDYFQERVQQYLTAYGLQLTADIVFYGHASDDELATLYQSASLYVFPSLYEGFGLPPLEAMGLGVPTVASAASCIPEILGDAAIYFNPENAREMAEKIHAVYTSPSLQAGLKEKGFAQINKYSWSATAVNTLQIYQDVL